MNDGNNNGQAMHGALKPPGPKFDKTEKPLTFHRHDINLSKQKRINLLDRAFHSLKESYSMLQCSVGFSSRANSTCSCENLKVHHW